MKYLKKYENQELEKIKKFKIVKCLLLILERNYKKSF
jgi:hypothetical protein